MLTLEHNFCSCNKAYQIITKGQHNLATKIYHEFFGNYLLILQRLNLSTTIVWIKQTWEIFCDVLVTKASDEMKQQNESKFRLADNLKSAWSNVLLGFNFLAEHLKSLKVKKVVQIFIVKRYLWSV